ncbi:PQQ-binding-like beta-propeller repeat protein [Candidatus Laterigemmans baculatus]|uniref:PQQ-binding-like beta-propeller repeat protein n=1 Tax=Candidatus Laterigemmans baculatus TaxID=2770505 RepID=UPI001F39AFC9|nr:PQQ-binding-like beta-propeller repeat protein [Candidatus Laterigemmans baculatus]
MRVPLLLSLGFCILTCTPLVADDWPQWMGPTRDGEYRETGLVESFPDGNAKIRWRTPIAGGYAGPAVAEGRVYVFDYQRSEGDPVNNPGQRATLKGRERLLCLDQQSGEVLWEHSYDCPYSISYPAGPRCTPTVDQGRVYILGSEGDLRCLDAKTGKLQWSKNFQTDYGAEVPMWGFAAHPLVEGEQLICMVGGDGQTVVSFDKQSGRELWKSLSASAVGYCPPAVIEAGGTRQLIVWHADALASLNPRDGQPYWEVPLQPDYAMAIARPQQSGNLLYASGIGNVAVMLRLKSDSPAVEEEVWSGGAPRRAVYSANSTPIFYQGVIYGSDCAVGKLIAVDAKTGERLWETFEGTRAGETRRISHGTAFVTHLAGSDRYLLFSELGDLILARLTAEEYQELSRAHVIEPTGDAFGRPVVWSHPAYAGRTAFVRNDKEVVAVSLDAKDYEP